MEIWEKTRESYNFFSFNISIYFIVKLFIDIQNISFSIFNIRTNVYNFVYTSENERTRNDHALVYFIYLNIYRNRVHRW